MLCYHSDGDKDAYCVHTHGLLVGTLDNFKPNAYHVHIKILRYASIFQSYVYPDKTAQPSFYKNTKIAQVCFPILCETCCLVKTTDQSQNVCREGEPDFDFSIL